MAPSSLLIATGGSITLFLYAIGIAVYRLTLHPLAKYPGPFLAKITSWYNTYHSIKKDRHLDQWKCHEIYGPIVRYAPNYVVINTTEALRDIYAGSRNSNVQKGQMYSFLHEKGVTSTHSVIDKSAHSRKRRILSHAFSDQALKTLEPYMVHNINIWTRTLGEDESGKKTDGWSSPKNMAKMANYVTFDILGDLCFGKSFGLLTDSKMRYMPRLTLSRMALFQMIGNSPLLPFSPYVQRLGIDKLFLPTIISDTNKFSAFALDAVAERLAHAKKEEEKADQDVRKDFFYWLTRARDPQTGETYTQKELWVEARLLIVAGSDTSAITTAAAFFYLPRRPKVLAKLQHELRSTFSSVDEIVMGPKINSCQYLRAVIDETLRMAPPVPSSLPREVLSGGMKVGEEFFPAGTVIGTSAYAIHHSEECYEDPWVYRPERWIADEKTGVTPEEASAARSAFCAFSLGSRGCVGKPMAYAELSIAFGRVFYLYDIRLAEGDTAGAGNPELEWGRRRKGEYQLNDVFTSGRDGPHIEFKLHP